MTFLELEPILQKVFPEEIGFTLDMTKDNIVSWDSIGHLNLILEIEDELRLSFTKVEIETINSLQDLLKIINTKID